MILPEPMTRHQQELGDMCMVGPMGFSGYGYGGYPMGMSGGMPQQQSYKSSSSDKSSDLSMLLLGGTALLGAGALAIVSKSGSLKALGKSKKSAPAKEREPSTSTQQGGSVTPTAAGENAGGAGREVSTASNSVANADRQSGSGETSLWKKAKNLFKRQKNNEPSSGQNQNSAYSTNTQYA